MALSVVSAQGRNIRLMSRPPQITRRQHLISKPVLEQFANLHGRLIAFGINHRSPDYKHHAAVGYERDFLSHAPNDAEMLWQSTERDLGPAIRAVIAGTQFEDKTHVEALKSAIALHYFRRRATKLVINSSIAMRVDERVNSYAASNPFPEVPAAVVASELRNRVAREQAAWLQEGIEQLFRDARDMLQTGAGLEVFTSQGDDLLIGDAAVISSDSNGVFGMLPFTSAASQLMPIGRRHLIALGPRNAEFDLPPDFVVRANRAQVRYATERVFIHPDSGLEGFVNKILDEDSRP